MGNLSFEELPFYDRPDLTPYLVHLTKNTKKDDDYSALDYLASILMTGKFGVAVDLATSRVRIRLLALWMSRSSR